MSSSDAIYEGIREYDSHNRDIEENCDVVVVGSGPTGAVAAYNLAEAGHDVILLEAGPVRRPHEFTLDGAKTLTEVVYEGGVRAMRGNIMTPTMQARVLGGGSHINSAMCLRTPDFCFEDWRDLYGVESITRQVLDPHYDRVEKAIGVAPTPLEVMGQRNLLFKKGCDAMGIESEPTPRNVIGCAGCGECFTGCPTRAKQSMDVSYIPAAIKKGLRVLTSVKVTRVLHAQGVALGILGEVVHPKNDKPSWKVRIRAKKVVLATGCITTPVVLQKSDVPDPGKMIGKDLQCHPGAAMLGVFEEQVNPWEGATQGYQSLAFLREGFKLEVLWAPPAVLAVRFPDFGHEFKDHLAAFKHGATWDAFFSLQHSKGSVHAKRGKSMNPDVRYHVSQLDMPRIQNGLATLADLYFAAGAKRILPGLNGIPTSITEPKQADLIRHGKMTPQDIVLASTHLFSSTRMGPDPMNSVVNERGEMHHLKGCYIVDTGIMPKSPAVNPMLTAMALADKFSLELAAQL